MNKKLYRIQVEVEPMEGTSLPSDVAGAFVNVYLGAFNITEAIELTESELLNDCYKPVNTYAAFEIDVEDEDFKEEEEGYPLKADLINLLENGGVWYGPFNCYPPEGNQLQ